jgi:CheY-like chemotaxis protein
LDGAMLIYYMTVCFTLGSWVQPLPALIILDVNMPNIDGVETMKWLKKSGYDHLRVVIATGAERSGLEAKLKKHGAQYFISKPFEPADYEVIKQALGVLPKKSG